MPSMSRMRDVGSCKSAAITTVASPRASRNPARIAENAPKLRESNNTFASKPSRGKLDRNASNDLSGEPSTTNTASTEPVTAVETSLMRLSRCSIEPSFLYTGTTIDTEYEFIVPRRMNCFFLWQRRLSRFHLLSFPESMAM